MTDDEFTAKMRALMADALTRGAAGSKKWEPWFDLVAFNVACANRTLTSDDLWRVLLQRRCPLPGEHRRMGNIMQGVERSGWAQPTDPAVYRIDEPATKRHTGRGQRIWVSLIYGTTPAIWPER